MRLAFCTSDRFPVAWQVRQRLIKRYGDCDPRQAEVVVVLGGDGFMLETLHAIIAHSWPVQSIYGINFGSVGFLLNKRSSNDIDLLARITQAQVVALHPLQMMAQSSDNRIHHTLAINEVVLLRQSHRTARLVILIDGIMRMPELVCDGALVATPAGSTAYNFSAYGPILPLTAELLALTPISAFRPRRWRGALLPRHAKITFEVLQAADRPVHAVADNQEIRSVQRVEVSENRSVTFNLLFDPEHNLEERILKEQFQ